MTIKAKDSILLLGCTPKAKGGGLPSVPGDW
jgi:hypothetical protein